MNMKKSFNNHTIVVLLLSDGTHRFTSGTYEMTNQAVWRFVRETMKNVSDSSCGVTIINEMYLACGVQSLRYTRNEVIELAEKYS
jgi:hypothetical protein